MKRNPREPGGGSAVDYYGVSYHGQANTHLDALCHVWDENGMWNGRRPEEVITYDGAAWGSVEHWKDRHHHPGRPAGRAETPGPTLRYYGAAHSRLGTGGCR